MRAGKRTLVQKSGHYVKLMDALKPRQWEAITKTAEALVKAPKPMLFKELEPVIPYSSDIEIIDCDSASDNSDDEGDGVGDGDDNDEGEDAMELDDVETDLGDEPEDHGLEA